jgi:hypothetical protein
VGTPSSGRVNSADRTTIAFDHYGDGRPVIVIGGAYNDRSTVAGVGGRVPRQRRELTRGRDSVPIGQLHVDQDR